MREKAYRTKLLLVGVFLILSLFILSPSLFAAMHTTTSTLKDYNPHQFDYNSDIRYACSTCHVAQGAGDPYWRDNYWGGIHNPTVRAAYQDATSGPVGAVAQEGWCTVCHDVHEASSSNKLLPAQLTADFCFLCHDGTAANVDGDLDAGADTDYFGYYVANNVIYGSVEVTGNVSQISRHNVNSNNTQYTYSNATSNIPLGGQVIDYQGNSTPLSCVSCHSPHGTHVVATFNSKTLEPQSNTTSSGWERGFGFDRTMILRNNLQNTTVTQYGAAWCLACHTQAFGGTHPDHPVDTSTEYNYFLEADPSDPRWVWDDYLIGYAFNHSYEATSGAPNPLCQSCHDDAVDPIGTSTVGYSLSGIGYTTWGIPTQNFTDNFPHEVANKKMLVESGDDLCLNCHPPSILP